MSFLSLPAAILLLSGLALSGPLVFANSDSRADTDEVSTQRVPFISLRNLTGSDEPDAFFGDERDRAYTGNCALSRTSFGAFSNLRSYVENSYFYIPDSLIDVTGISKVKRKTMWKDLKKSAGGDRPVLYLHGYNMSFARSCKQAALFARNLGIEKRVLLFSWPSDGALLNYPRDEVDLQWSVLPLEGILNEMQAQFGAGGFDVVAHSLGGRGIIYALQQVAQRTRGKQPILNQLLLVAPDADAGIFKQYLPSIRPLVANITLYVSDNDRPLALSREVHGYPRLGETGQHLDDLQGVEIVDVSSVGRRSFSGHLYHLYQDPVIADIKLLLETGKSASQRPGVEKTARRYWRLTEAR